MAPSVTTQINYALTVQDGPSTDSAVRTLVKEFDIREGLSELFSVSIVVTQDGLDLSLDDVMGKEALFTLNHPDGDRHFHGIVAEAEELEEVGDEMPYRLTIVPRMRLMELTRESRIFQGKSTPEILAEVFEPFGISGGSIDDRTQASYDPRDYCVQYGESSLDFARRLMEEEGIYFWFEHSDSDHVLVLSDTASNFERISGGTVTYEPPSSGTASEAHIWRFRPEQRIRSGKASLLDYAFKTPTADMAVDDSADNSTDLEVYDYPGGYVDRSLGDRLVQVRSEELQARRKTASGCSTVTHMTTGCLFELVDYVNDDLEPEYLLLRLRHRGVRVDAGASGDDTLSEYSNEFEVMPSSVPFRAPRKTRQPRISGVQTAVVTGPSGDEIYVDEFGRVKVQFHWDRLGNNDEQSSCWIRVSQGAASGGFGQISIPRIGDEVIVQFLEGDPDRPLITGRVYNGQNATPYSLPEHKTRSTTKTQSTKESSGFNEMRFEDKKDSEEIYVHAQKDYNEKVLNCHTTDVGADQTNTVHGNQVEQVDIDQTMTVDGNRTLHIKTNFDETVDGTETRKVTGAVDETFESTETRKVTGAVDETYSSTETRTVTGDVTETFLANETRTITGNQTETIAGNQTETIAGSVTSTIAGAYTVTATGGITMTAPGGVKMVDTTYSWFTPKVDWFGASIMSIGAYSMGIKGLSIGVTGVSVSEAAVKATSNKVAIDFKLFKKEDAPTVIKNEITVIEIGSVNIKTKALNIFM
jgi:type VI secretion system secreted protein VgrG